MTRLNIVCICLVLLVGSRNSHSAEPTVPLKIPPAHAAQMKAGLEIFQAGVRQTLVGRCVKCHGGDKTEGKFDLSTREALLKGGETGAAVVIGDAKKSLLMKLVRHEDEPNMPEDGAKLPDVQIAALARWIELGAPYDRPLVEKETRPDAWVDKRIDPAARQFWSFLPLKNSEPPKVANAAWCITPIDRFVMAKLEEKKLTPNSATDKRKLVRRAYFDLIGLPPSAEEVEAFITDKSPEAYKKLIDHLLDSPHYGERWGRHWLDVARFGESHGFEQDYDRPHAYHYRDFVIKALNSDMPFDQFVRWQLAGDEIEPENPLAWMATGFLGAGVFPTQLTEKEFESARYDELDDMAATMGTAMLGITIGCARCHDHKFDPIPAGDYYRLLNSFATAIRSNREFSLSSDADKQAAAKWRQDHEPLVAAVAKFEQSLLPARFENWLRTESEKVRKSGGDVSTFAPAWVILEPTEMKSSGGATLTKQDDGSVLATGKNPEFDSYTFVAHTDLKGITAVRLEALTDKSMAKNGPGRAPNSNIGLSKITVKAGPANDASVAVAVKLVNPKATFEQNKSSLSIAAALDDDPKSGWAVDPQFGKHHAAVFEAAEAIGFEGGTKLTITLDFQLNIKHNIGRPRLAISTAARPVALDGESQRQTAVEVFSLLRQPPEILTKEQRESLLKWYRATDVEWKKLNDAVQLHLAKKSRSQVTQVMVVSEGVKPIPHHADGRGFPHFYKETYFLKRGSAEQKQGTAHQSFLQVLMRTSDADAAGTSPVSTAAHWQTKPVENAKTSQRRLALSNWATDTQYGAGHLLARVIVNRLWQHHLGRGIVSTPNDFGYQGQRPTHPELLDWLAVKLIENNWRLKPIHKLIMASAVYTQSSDYDEADAKVDPENQWNWRFSPQRLEAEIIRDAMLAASGALDRTPFGPGTLDESHKRRSIYFMVKRSRLIPMMQLFDSPEPLASVGDRPSTTIAPQALLFMNNPNVRNYAKNFAKQLAPAAEQSIAAAVRTGYLQAVGRPPSADELQETVLFVEQQTVAYNEAKQRNARELALADFCQVLLSMNEFVYVE